MDLKLNTLAFAAAKKAFQDSQDRVDLIEEFGKDAEGVALQQAIETYIIASKAEGTTHELSVIPGGVPGYEYLAMVLKDAYDQSARGKGRERHNKNDKPFPHQPIMTIGRMVGLGYPTGQAMKKIQEAATMAERGNRDAAYAEFLGAIVYTAAACILLRERQPE